MYIQGFFLRYFRVLSRLRFGVLSWSKILSTKGKDGNKNVAILQDKHVTFFVVTKSAHICLRSSATNQQMTTLEDRLMLKKSFLVIIQ